MSQRRWSTINSAGITLVICAISVNRVGLHSENAVTSAVVNLSGCVSNWYVSYSGTSSWTLINTDPDALPITDLRFDRGYSDPTDLSHGYLDFNRDGKSDVFSAVPIGGGLYQWRYSSGATSPWINLAYDSTPPDQLRFGDFNGDGYTDVFAAVPQPQGWLQWMYSSGGVSSYQNLAFDTTPLSELRFGDFNGDHRSDFFFTTVITNSLMQWWYFYYRQNPFAVGSIKLAYDNTPADQLCFADFNGDGITDVFKLERLCKAYLPVSMR
jgi:hypothetical protein